MDFGKNENLYPMRVYLLGGDGSLYFVWLPLEREGRYAISSEENGNVLPFYITAENGDWYMTLEHNGQFMLNNAMAGNRILLQDRIFATAFIGHLKFAVYTEVEHERDNVYLPYFVQPNTPIVIGRNPDCDIYYSHIFISREHAVLTWRNSQWIIQDKDSKNGVFLNGHRVQCEYLKAGDIVYILGLKIIIGVGYICINNANNRVQFTNPNVRQIVNVNDVMFSPQPQKQVSTEYDRKPRKRASIESKCIEIEPPPANMTSNKMLTLLRMGNPLVAGGRDIISGNILSAVTSFVLPVLTQGMTEKDRKEYETLRSTKYREYLGIKQGEIATEKRNEERLLTELYPPLNIMFNYSTNYQRLWERRKYDDDFLKFRLGSGNSPLIAKINYEHRKFQIEEDSLLDEMYALAENPVFLNNVPIMLSLKENYVVSMLGSEDSTLLMAKKLIAQIALTHAYDEVKIIVLASEKASEKLDFVRYLPHNWDNDKNIRFFASSKNHAQQLSKYLNDKWQYFTNEKYKSEISNTIKKEPAYIVFALDKEIYDSIELLKYAVQSEQYVGVSIITAFGSAPKECSKLISLGQNAELIELSDADASDCYFVPDAVNETDLQYSMQKLESVKLRLDSKKDYKLPNMISFLAMYKAGRVEHLNPLKRWEDNNPVKSLAAPLGIGTDGQLFMLDLHEKKQGPHGLVAGGTGSGKSEFIITYILSMAVNYSPDEVAFILIDYKGGGLADAFVDPKRGIHLPHVIGTITNLDGAAIQRSLLSINSELKRRQEVFKKTKSITNEGTMDIYDYQRLYRNKVITEPMPHLFIISDEFAELKKQEPEFMDELISIARIGRSLGVHLILATQKPSGVVNDQIWSNTKFRICLRVADKADSMEMLKRPEAAEIKNTGRFYLQVGYNELFAMGQSAWCGAGYIPKDNEETESNEDRSVQFIDTVGQVSYEAKHKLPDNLKEEGKQIVAIVKYLSDLAVREKITPRSLWCEPLSSDIEMQSLLETAERNDEHITAVIGMIDEPKKQTQFPFLLDIQSFHHMLLCGPPGCGKNTLIKSMLYSLIYQYSPEDLNYYIVDFSGGALYHFSKAPHCGAYITENDELDFSRLLAMIKDMVAQRKKKFAEADVTSFDAYRKVNKMPLNLIIFSNYTVINQYKNGYDYHNALNSYMKEAASYGFRFIISCNHLNEVHTKTQQESDYRIALRAKDRYEYQDILMIKCPFTVPSKNGRGICVIHDEAFEFNTAIVDVNLSEPDRVAKMKQRLELLKTKYEKFKPAQKLAVANTEETYVDFSSQFDKGCVPLGYRVDTMKKVSVPLHQMYSMSVYLGNPLGIRPVITNFLYAAIANDAELIVVKKSSDSVFDNRDTISFLNTYGVTPAYIEATQDGLEELKDKLTAVVVERNIYRDEFCEKENIPKTNKGRVLKAESYIRSKTRPLVIFFESFGDICRLERTKEIRELQDIYSTFFEKTKGYNIYFAAFFYPEDADCRQNEFLQAFNKMQFCLFFGGKFDKQCMLSSYQAEFSNINKVQEKYDMFFMHYREQNYALRMPSGVLLTGNENPEDASIV